MDDLIKLIIIFIPFALIIFIAGLALSGTLYPKIKLMIGDLLKLIGWVGKSVRKYSVENEYQGTINGAIHEYNKNFVNPILPNCKIQWVTAENQKNILKENEAIICLSFDKKDHNLNFFNATLNFVQTALISKAKYYLNNSSSKAIDLLTTHIILRNNRKEVLTTFRNKLNEFDVDTISEFQTLAPTNDKGLFLNLLLPELYFYGELINTLTPSIDFKVEANSFLKWFIELATREFHDKTNLKFTVKNFKVGVILVGKDEIWESYGTTAYIKWADYYSSEGFNSVYVLGKGNKGFERATSVIKILTESKGFEQLNKNPKIKCITTSGDEYIVTCYSLRPNRAMIAYNAWEKLKECFNTINSVPVIIDVTQKESVIVNAFGLKFEIENSLLSEIPISDARKVFHVEDELYLKIIKLDSENQNIVFSNKGTISDPKQFIENILSEKKIHSCKIERIEKDKQGNQIGLKVSSIDLVSWVYIPRYKATKSRFLDLSSKYKVSQYVNIFIESFNSSSSNFIGVIENIVDPWEAEKFNSIKIDTELNVIVKEINEFFVTCEIEEGLECRFSQYEISWNQDECITSKFNIDQEVKVKVIYINKEKKLILVSLKRLFKTPELKFFDENKNQEIKAEIIELISEKGIVIHCENTSFKGFIHWFEIGWGAIGHFENIFEVGQIIYPVVFDFDNDKNRVRFSLKRKFNHQFKEWTNLINLENSHKGKVIGYFESSVQVELNNQGFKVQACIQRKCISNIAFIEYEDMKFYLPIGEIFEFTILEINEQKQTILLTRKKFLNSCEKPTYGKSVFSKVVKIMNNKIFFYSNYIEGWSEVTIGQTSLGSTIEIIPISISKNEFSIV